MDFCWDTSKRSYLCPDPQASEQTSQRQQERWLGVTLVSLDTSLFLLVSALTGPKGLSGTRLNGGGL